MKDRIRQLMEDQHLTQQNFAQMIGISTATLSNIFNGKTNPSLSIVDGIHKSFPQVNVYWVLYGTPPMYQNQASQGGSEEGAADMHQGITDGAAGGAEGMKQGSQPSGAASAEPMLDFGADGIDKLDQAYRYRPLPSLCSILEPKEPQPPLLLPRSLTSLKCMV